MVYLSQAMYLDSLSSTSQPNLLLDRAQASVKPLGWLYLACPVLLSTVVSISINYSNHTSLFLVLFNLSFLTDGLMTDAGRDGPFNQQHEKENCVSSVLVTNSGLHLQA
mmetsp:Transcript_59995/g.159474  ORF Transcript_59995/g.159474 Transcript_59995/m.159474 type:complete len:109 (-) Transcript_59995:43-369(-)